MVSNMDNFPLVSVVIPTFSRPVYLKRCIDSVLNQTYSNLEIIVVDDNNPNTAARIETNKTMALYKENSMVKYLQHDTNRNGSAARNTGWSASSGEYITFLDDDDEIANTKIEKQVKCLESLDKSWGMCYTGYKVIKEKGDNQISSESRTGNCYLDALMRTLFLGSGSNLLLRKSVVDELEGYDVSFQRNKDIEFLVRACEKYKIAYVDEVLLTIYQEGNRTVRTFEQLDNYTLYYLERFKNRIDCLSPEERERVISVISLERFRLSITKKRIGLGFRILLRNHVKLKYQIKYFIYLIRRKITHESYGFNGL